MQGGCVWGAGARYNLTHRVKFLWQQLCVFLFPSSAVFFFFFKLMTHYSLPLRWRNPRQNTTCLWSGRSSAGPPKRDVSHSSAARCAQPWCVFAEEPEKKKNQHAVLETRSCLITDVPLFCWEWPFSVGPWLHNTWRPASFWPGTPWKFNLNKTIWKKNQGVYYLTGKG